MSTLETWYTNNLATYEDRIDRNAGFCGDRSINTGSTSWWNYDTKKGYGTNETAYGAHGRMYLPRSKLEADLFFLSRKPGIC